MRSILMRMFGRPQGVLGRLGGVIMARMNADCGAWVSDLLKVGPNDSVLEVGFGPGVVIQRCRSSQQRGMSRALIRHGRWLSKLGLGMHRYPERSCRPPARFRGELAIRRQLL